MKVAEKVAQYRTRATMMEPADEQQLSRSQRRARSLASMGVFALLDTNDWLIGRFVHDAPSIWDPADWPWIKDVEARTPAIRAELEAYAAAAALPLVAEVSGFDPDSEGSRESVPVGRGAWRTVILFANGKWIDATARHFPVTRACFADLHPKANVGFSALDPNSHIEAHVGPNRGALRFPLPIIVPGRPGDCRIRIGDEMVHWREGEAIVFDLKTNHEAWNESDQLRVLLMVEILQPLPRPLSWVNRLAQYSYRWHPSYRQMPQRITRFGRRHDEAASTA